MKTAPRYFTPAWVADQLSQPFPDWRPFPEETFRRIEALHWQGTAQYSGTLMGKLALALGCRLQDEWPAYDALLSEWLGDAYIGMNAVERRRILDAETIRREMAASATWEEVDARMRDHFLAASQAFLALLQETNDEHHPDTQRRSA